MHSLVVRCSVEMRSRSQLNTTQISQSRVNRRKHLWTFVTQAGAFQTGVPLAPAAFQDDGEGRGGGSAPSLLCFTAHLSLTISKTHGVECEKDHPSFSFSTRRWFKTVCGRLYSSRLGPAMAGRLDGRRVLGYTHNSTPPHPLDKQNSTAALNNTAPTARVGALCGQDAHSHDTFV